MNMTTTNYVLTGSDGTPRFYEYFADLLNDLDYLGFTEYEIEAREKTFEAVPMKTVKNLMSGKEIEIPVDTPRSCDPSSETYWSM
jgi:hypothetical protein